MRAGPDGTVKTGNCYEYRSHGGGSGGDLLDVGHTITYVDFTLLLCFVYVYCRCVVGDKADGQKE